MQIIVHTIQDHNIHIHRNKFRNQNEKKNKNTPIYTI